MSDLDELEQHRAAGVQIWSAWHGFARRRSSFNLNVLCILRQRHKKMLKIGFIVSISMRVSWLWIDYDSLK